MKLSFFNAGTTNFEMQYFSQMHKYILVIIADRASGFRIRTCILLFFFFMLHSAAHSHENFLFKRIFINDGLSNNSINSILQTRDGFLWIATKDGLNRYDGQRFKIFKNSYGDTTSLPENYVMCMFESSDGILWVGTWGEGLLKYDKVNESFISCRLTGAKDEFIQCIFEDHNRNIWFGTTEGGLFCLSPESGTIENYADNLPGAKPFPANNITCIVEDGSDRLWIGTWNSGMIQFTPENGTIRQYNHEPGNCNSIADNGVWDIRMEPGKSLLLSTFRGIDRFDIVTGNVQHNPGIDEMYNDMLTTAIRQTYVDRKGRMWVGTYDYNGLFLIYKDENGNFRNERFISEDDNDQSISIDRIRCIYEDMKGNLWFGTENGLNKIPATQPFRQFTYLPLRPNSLGGRVVSSIQMDHNNILWIGYGGGGFDRIDLVSDNIKHYKHEPADPNSLSDDDVISIYISSDGNLWIATMYGGLIFFNTSTGKFTSYRTDPEDKSTICSDWVLQVLEINDSLFLVGTNSGLDVLDRETEEFSRYAPEITEGTEKLPGNISVNVLFEDSKQFIWIGTWLDGVFCYDPATKHLTQYLHDVSNSYSIGADKITVIHEDPSGDIWFGTHSGGLCKLDNESGRFLHFNTQTGMPNDVVFGILTDSGSDLWISTMKGLARMDHMTGEIRVYDELDGLVNNQFNWRASFKDQHGIMYFGGINGFVSFNPDLIIVDTVPPLVAITSFTIFNKETGNQQTLPATREIVLGHHQNFFSIEFNALDMAPIQKHKYAYMLEGIDQNWIYSDTRNIAFYTDLHKGSFHFLAKACNADNIWSEPVSLSIIILPAWWNTLWIKLLGLLAIFGIGILVTRVRFWHLLEIERIRLNIASDLHDEMGSNLSSISVDSQQLMLQNKKGTKSHQLSSDIYKTTNETIDSIRDIIWFINPKNVSGEDMLFKMREKAATMLAGLKWSFKTSEGLNLDVVKLEIRRNIFLIYKEILTNVVRHSDAKSCIIKLEKHPHNLELNICDNGRGFDLNKGKSTNGLTNLYHRAQKIGAQLKITSTVGEGTCMTLELPLKSNKIGIKRI
ncbi:MAG: hypothetical protein ISS19_12100 [Bacteroidales bacterium]|nr:hypothetical protein [Bacteroidales bacterium]